MLLRIAYHESVHTGQLSDYMSTMDNAPIHSFEPVNSYSN